MILRTGVDIIDINRVERAAHRHGERFYKRFFTDLERAQCGDRFASLAARVAAKEAVGKALGTGIGDVSWRDIEVISGERGAPSLALHGRAAELAQQRGLSQWSLSLSHTRDQAVAFVVASASSNSSSVYF